MKIALDYDETYNKDRAFWNEVIWTALAFGHEVMIVTARCPVKDVIPEEKLPLPLTGVPVHYCNGVAKKWFMHHHKDIDIDVWIDDKPDNILNNSTATKEILAGWRTSEAYTK